METQDAISLVNRAAVPLSFESPRDYCALLEWIGGRRLVLIGEASHGTHDFYRERIRITQLLLQRKGFSGIAIEGDWPDAYRVHRFVRGRGEDGDAEEALRDFRKFPAWMWRNMDVLAFIEWLRDFNVQRSPDRQVGFYGMDLYSLHASMQSVLNYLDKVDPDAAARARYRYSCFDQFGEDAQAYGYAASFGLSASCEEEAVAQMVEMRRRAHELAQRDGRLDADEHFFAQENARLVHDAARYYRAMFGGRAESWNVRDSHMADTLSLLLQRFPEARVVVWAHNSHLGDARATQMSAEGEVNLGQLLRERFGDEVYSIGFTTHSGEVTAASKWDGMAERKRLRLAVAGSYEALFHECGLSAFLLSTRDVRAALQPARLERAVGVIYQPQTERLSHYFQCDLGGQFDAVIHIDRTKALIPLERTSHWEMGELPETFPFAV